jgi:hypothetical protein
LPALSPEVSNPSTQCLTRSRERQRQRERERERERDRERDRERGRERERQRDPERVRTPADSLVKHNQTSKKERKIDIDPHMTCLECLAYVIPNSFPNSLCQQKPTSRTQTMHLGAVAKKQKAGEC